MSIPKLEKSIASLRITWLGALAYFLNSSHKSRIMSNIDLVFKDSITLRDKQQLCKAFFSHTIASIREVLQMSFSGNQYLRKRIEVRGIEHLLNAAAKNRGVFLLTGHLGNFEFAQLLFTAFTHQFDGQFHAVRKSLKSPFIEQFLFSRFKKNGVNIIHKDNAVQGIKKALRENGAIWFTMDQRPPSRSRSGCETDFLGIQTTAYKTIATLAHRWKIPVIPSITYRVEKGRHIVEFHPELEWQEHADREIAIIENTKLYSKTIESFILQHPEQWIWSYNRWNKDLKKHA